MSLNVQAPVGSHFEFEEVKTKKGTESLGDVPILVWDDVQAAIDHYGVEGIINILDGTSVRVSMQSIARRLKAAGKGDDEIAQKQVEFKPGKREPGNAKPETKAARAAKAASGKVDTDVLTAFLKKVADGEIGEADLKAYVG